MPNFQYTGQLPQGTAVTGTIEAVDIDAARRQLDDLALHVSTLAQTETMRQRRSLSRDDLLFFNQQLAALAENKMALDVGLRAVAKDLERGPLKTTIQEVAAALESGVPLEEAIGKQKGRFPELYANVLRSGAESNQLGATLLSFNNHLTLLNASRNMIWEALTYPLLLLAMLFAIFSFFMLVIVPSYADSVFGLIRADGSSYTYDGGVLSDPTVLVLKLSEIWPTVLLVVGALAAAAFVLLMIFRKSFALQRLRERVLRSLPFIGSAYRDSLLARFTSSAALATRMGQPLPAILRLAGGATGNARLVADAGALAEHVEAGNPPDAFVARKSMIPALVAYTLQTAGARGHLAHALADLARNYETLARYRLGRFRVIFTPIILSLVALFIAVVILSLFAPLFSIVNQVSGF